MKTHTLFLAAAVLCCSGVAYAAADGPKASTKIEKKDKKEKDKKEKKDKKGGVGSEAPTAVPDGDPSTALLLTLAAAGTGLAWAATRTRQA